MPAAWQQKQKTVLAALLKLLRGIYERIDDYAHAFFEVVVDFVVFVKSIFTQHNFFFPDNKSQFSKNGVHGVIFTWRLNLTL